MIHVIDFEVFKYDWLCVIQNRNIGKTVIVNDRKALVKYYEDNKNDVFVGYNIRGYDQFIFKGILLGFDPKEINDYIILCGQKGYSYSRDFNKIPLKIFDVKFNQAIGLKQLEGFMGDDIRETTVPFNIDRKLNVKELEEVIFYCEHDVAETMKVFTKCFEEFTSQLEIINTFRLSSSNLSKTKAQLTATVLNAQRKKHNDQFDYVIPDNLKIKKYKNVVDWFVEQQGNKNLLSVKDFYNQKLTVDVAGVPHVFAWGGIHGARVLYNESGYFINVDVASYYPSLMIEYDYISRNVTNPNKFKEVYRKRLEYKAMKDKRQAPLKIVLNSTYGAMKDQYNNLYDPLMANNVCVTGQLLLLDLIEQLEPCCEIIQSNTDGVLVKLKANNDEEATAEFNKVKAICDEWQERSKMKLEFDDYVKVIQKDVNNYIIIDKDGNYKSKGGWVKKLNELDYNLPIVNRALINYFVHGVEVEETVNNCDDLMEFQIIYKVQGNYTHAQHNNTKLTEKYFRVFASKDTNDTTLYKVKFGEKLEKFAECPENCFIDNSEVKDKQVDTKLNKKWYIDLAKKRIIDFTGEDF